MASNSQLLKSHYPWTTTPLIASAPMRLIATKPLALSVSRAGGFGFLGIGTDASILSQLLESSISTLSESPIPNTPPGLLPFGIGFIIWGASLPQTLQALKETPLKPAAILLFAPHKLSDFKTWTSELRNVCGSQTKIWIQVGTVAMAVEVAKDCSPDVLVIQGFDAGGHGLAHSSSIMSLLPECKDILSKEGFGNIPLIAAGGIMDGRGVAAALSLGADGICMGTRFLGSEEAEISQGYKKAVIDSGDGGVTTKRTSVYDQLRGTIGWPKEYNARGVLNRSFWDSEAGIEEEENKRLYEEALGKGDEGWGLEGRLTTYAGTGVGLVREVMPAANIVKEVVSGARECLEKARAKL